MKRKIITTQEFERRIKNEMKLQRKDDELKAGIMQRANTKAFCESDKRVNSLRRYKKHQIITNEQNAINEYEKLQKDLANKENEEIKYNKIVNELQKIKQNKERNESLKKRICSNSDELKELHKSLNAAYLGLDLEQQIKSKELKEINNKYQHEKLLKEMDEINKKYDKIQQQQENEKKRKLIESQQIIEKQLREKELKKNKRNITIF